MHGEGVVVVGRIEEVDAGEAEKAREPAVVEILDDHRDQLDLLGPVQLREQDVEKRRRIDHQEE